MENYEFSVDWFSGNIPVWKQIVDKNNPQKIVEIGTFEGKSACFLVDYISKNANLELHCIDTWEGGVEHKEGGSASQNMSAVERRFQKNIAISVRNAANEVDLHIHKGYSDAKLAMLLSSGYANYFDLAYIDGSHQAPDVLLDAILSFKLVKVGGILIFDDYLWQEPLPGGTDILRCPKPAIDSFTNIFARKVKIFNAPLGQLYLRKIAD